MRVLVVVVMSFAAVVAAAGADDKLKVPNLVGKSFDEARKILSATGFAGEPEDHLASCERSAPDVDGGIVQCQDPSPGELAGKYSIIVIHLMRAGHKKGDITAEHIRPLLGNPVGQVKDALGKLGFVGTYVTKPADDDHAIALCEPGNVCWIDPRDEIDPHGTVVLYVQSR